MENTEEESGNKWVGEKRRRWGKSEADLLQMLQWENDKRLISMGVFVEVGG